jgi:hypothetical protein
MFIVLLEPTRMRPWWRLMVMKVNAGALTESQMPTELHAHGTSAQAEQDRWQKVLRFLTLLMKKWGMDGLDIVAAQRGQTEEDVRAPPLSPPLSLALALSSM